MGQLCSGLCSWEERRPEGRPSLCGQPRAEGICIFCNPRGQSCSQGGNPRETDSLNSSVMRLLSSEPPTPRGMQAHRAVDRMSQLLATWSTLWGCLRTLTMWCLASPRARDLREQNGNDSIFYNLTLEVTYCHFHNVLLITQVSPSQYGRGLALEDISAKR